MKDGVVQQVDTPQNLYNKPCNLFVAGFIGSPQMNFIDAKVEAAGGDLLLKIGEYTLKVPPQRKQPWKMAAMWAKPLSRHPSGGSA